MHSSLRKSKKQQQLRIQILALRTNNMEERTHMILRTKAIFYTNSLQIFRVLEVLELRFQST